jgi:polyisoprenoid-binding protein YceI
MFVSIWIVCLGLGVFSHSKHRSFKNDLMKKFIFPLAAVLLIAGSAFTVLSSQDWKIADNYSVKFDGGDPSGQFGGLKGTISFDPNDLVNSKFDASIDVTTINTGNGMKNTHAKSEKWFDAEKYPTIQFTSSAITKTASGYEARGILNMHGVQKEITIPFTFDDNIFKGSITVNRLDYNINTAEPAHGASTFKVDIAVPVTK